jgi:UDP-N-acetylmuramate--alanine ligase
VAVGHDAAHIAGAEAVVTSTAVKADNPEVIAARASRVPVVPRAVMLAELMRLKQGIAIAGTHGKTTTTSLVTERAGRGRAWTRPSSSAASWQRRCQFAPRLGRHIVVEADESDASFLNLLPVLSVVTNIDADHMDTYGHDLERLRGAFVDFLHRMPFYGAAIVCSDDPGVRAILPMHVAPARQLRPRCRGCRCARRRAGAARRQMRFTCQRRNGIAMPDLAVTLNLPGEHNVRNALAAIAVATELELPDAPIVSARWPVLPASAGASSAMATVACADGGAFTLIDDYGHHPVEMAAVIAAARGAFPGRRLVLAFQPHRYTPHPRLLRGLRQGDAAADAVLLTEVYPPARHRSPGPTARAGACAAGRRRRSGVRRRRGRSAAGDLAAARATATCVITMGAGRSVVCRQGLKSLGGRAHEGQREHRHRFHRIPGPSRRSDGWRQRRARGVADVGQRRADGAAVAGRRCPRLRPGRSGRWPT